MLFRLLVCVAALAAVSCTEKRRPEPDQAALLAKIQLKAAPSPSHELDTQFGGKIKLVGYDVSEEPVHVGKPFTITWYWQVLEPLDSGYQVFTHLSDGKINRINLDSTRNLRRVYPESGWKKGEYLRDDQEIALPNDWDSETAVFYLGFYSGETRLRVERGSEDGARRAEGARLPVSSGPATKSEPEPAVARLVARRATGPIKLDGTLDEADWRAAQSTGPLVNTFNGEPGEFEARVQVLYDDQRVYFGFVVADDYLKTTFKQNDDHLWEQDTVEVMLDPEGDARNYFELQVSPRGVHFDTRYDSPRQPRPFGHVDWDSKVEAKVALNGKLDDEAADTGYVAEFALPWTAFATGDPPAAKPTAGATWRMNFFVMDARSGEQRQRAVAWSPPRVGDFHTLAQFGRVVFLDEPSAAAKASKTN